MAKEVAEEYASALADLTPTNNPPLLSMLTMLAEDYHEYAPVIVQVIENHLNMAPENMKLPLLYLMDSIVKTVKKSYIQLFTQNLVSMFCSIFEKADEKVRNQMLKLRWSWNDVFPAKKLLALDTRIKGMCSYWPASVNVNPPTIHINPKFIKPGCVPSSIPMTHPPGTAVVYGAMRQELLQTQKELIELQKKKLELELMQTKAYLDLQQKKFETQSSAVPTASKTEDKVPTMPPPNMGSSKTQQHIPVGKSVISTDLPHSFKSDLKEQISKSSTAGQSYHSRDPRINSKANAAVSIAKSGSYQHDPVTAHLRPSRKKTPPLPSRSSPERQISVVVTPRKETSLPLQNEPATKKKNPQSSKKKRISPLRKKSLSPKKRTPSPDVVASNQKRSPSPGKGNHSPRKSSPAHKRATSPHQKISSNVKKPGLHKTHTSTSSLSPKKSLGVKDGSQGEKIAKSSQKSKVRHDDLSSECTLKKEALVKSDSVQKGAKQSKATAVKKLKQTTKTKDNVSLPDSKKDSNNERRKRSVDLIVSQLKKDIAEDTCKASRSKKMKLSVDENVLQGGDKATVIPDKKTKKPSKKPLPAALSKSERVLKPKGGKNIKKKDRVRSPLHSSVTGLSRKHEGLVTSLEQSDVDLTGSCVESSITVGGNSSRSGESESTSTLPLKRSPDKETEPLPKKFKADKSIFIRLFGSEDVDLRTLTPHPSSPPSPPPSVLSSIRAVSPKVKDKMDCSSVQQSSNDSFSPLAVSPDTLMSQEDVPFEVKSYQGKDQNKLMKQEEDKDSSDTKSITYSQEVHSPKMPCEEFNPVPQPLAISSEVPPQYSPNECYQSFANKHSTELHESEVDKCNITSNEDKSDSREQHLKSSDKSESGPEESVLSEHNNKMLFGVEDVDLRQLSQTAPVVTAASGALDSPSKSSWASLKPQKSDSRSPELSLKKLATLDPLGRPLLYSPTVEEMQPLKPKDEEDLPGSSDTITNVAEKELCVGGLTFFDFHKMMSDVKVHVKETGTSPHNSGDEGRELSDSQHERSADTELDDSLIDYNSSSDGDVSDDIMDIVEASLPEGSPPSPSSLASDSSEESSSEDDTPSPPPMSPLSASASSPPSPCQPYSQDVDASEGSLQSDSKKSTPPSADTLTTDTTNPIINPKDSLIPAKHSLEDGNQYSNQQSEKTILGDTASLSISPWSMNSVPPAIAPKIVSESRMVRPPDQWASLVSVPPPTIPPSTIAMTNPTIRGGIQAPVWRMPPNATPFATLPSCRPDIGPYSRYRPPGPFLQSNPYAQRKFLHIPRLNHRLLEFVEPFRTLIIGGDKKNVRFYDETAIIMNALDDPRELSFQNGTRRVIIDETTSWALQFNTPYKEVWLDGQKLLVRLGSPTRELYINGVYYEGTFGGPPFKGLINGVVKSIRLEGPKPNVRIGQNKRTDLVAGEVVLVIDAQYCYTIFLDGTLQKFEVNGIPCVLRFCDSLRLVLLNEKSFKMRFGEHLSIFINDERHYIVFLHLPGVHPGSVNISNMEGKYMTRRFVKPSKPGNVADDVTSIDLHKPADDKEQNSTHIDLDGDEFGCDPVSPYSDLDKDERSMDAVSSPKDSTLIASEGPITASADQDYRVKKVVDTEINKEFKDHTVQEQPTIAKTTNEESSQNEDKQKSSNIDNIPINSSGQSMELLACLMSSAYNATGAVESYNVELSDSAHPVQVQVTTPIGPSSHSVTSVNHAPLRPPPAPQISASVTASAGSASTIDVGELFQKLVAIGMVPAAASVEEEATVKAVDFSQPETLKIRQPGLVQRLYSGMQCSSCGVRFSPEETVKYSQHLDWHFRKNRRERDAARIALSRKWYYDVSDWIQYQEIEDLEERAQSWFEMQEITQGKSPTEEQEEKLEEPTVAARDVPEEKPSCFICKDVFEQYYSQDREEWVLRRAILVDDKVCHPLCYEDYKKESSTNLGTMEKEEIVPEEPETIVLDDNADDEAPKIEETPQKMDEVLCIESSSSAQSSQNGSVSSSPEKIKSPVNETGDTEAGDPQSDDDILHIEVLEQKIESYEIPDEDDEDPPNKTSLDEPVSDSMANSEDFDWEGSNSLDYLNIPIKKEKLELIDPSLDPSFKPVSTTIDGDMEFEGTTQVSVPKKIKINIRSQIKKNGASGSTASPISVEQPNSPIHLEIEASQPPPPGEELCPASVKPRILSSKLKECPPQNRGKELSALCSIM